MSSNQNYHYLFKYIVIGDSSNFFWIIYVKASENPALLINLRMENLMMKWNVHLELSLVVKQYRCSVKLLNFRFGTQ
jgi:hypothetical protein